MTIIASYLPEVKDLLAFQDRLKDRTEVCTSFANKLVKEGLEQSGLYDSATGTEVKKIKTLLSGIVAVKASKKKKAKRAKSESPRASRSESPGAPPSRCLFNWF